MFSKKDSGAPAPRKSAVPSILSADLVITGNLVSEGEIQIDGTVEGDISSQKLTVSATAVVRGSVEAETVVIAGAVTGHVKARDVTLNKTAKVIADVVQERLTIEPGAFFEGNCRHFPDSEESAGKPLERIGAKPNALRAALVDARKKSASGNAEGNAEDQESAKENAAPA